MSTNLTASRRLIPDGQPEPSGLAAAGMTGRLENDMSNKVQVFPTTGGVSVEVNDDFVTIEQEDTLGEGPSAVSVPRPLFKEVLSTIFAAMHSWELQEIAELCEAHAKPVKG